MNFIDNEHEKFWKDKYEIMQKSRKTEVQK